MAVPAPLAVTVPSAPTVATPLLELLQVIPLLLALSGFTVAVSFAVSPSVSSKEVLSRLIPVTFTTAAVTVTVQLAVLPPSAVVTVMVAVPGATAVTLPFSSTVAIFPSLVVHFTALLAALLGATVAVRVSLPPAVRAKVFLFSVTPVTGMPETVTLQLAVLPPSSVVAVMVAVPAATAVTLPFSSTVAIFWSLVVHFTALLVAFSGATVAVRVSVLPTVRDNSVLFRVTPVTGTWETAPTDSVPVGKLPALMESK